MGVFASQTKAKVQQDDIVFELETGGVVRQRHATYCWAD